MPSSEYATRWKQAAPQCIGAAQHVRKLARDSLLSVLGATKRGSAPQFLRCLFCHYVFDDEVDAFERTIVALRRIGSFVNTDACVRMLAGDAPISGRHFHLSFDDGFRNNLTNALPILRKHGVPAIFFAPSAMIGADRAAAGEYCRRIDYRAAIEMLTWDDLKSMVAAGCEIGSHTRTHARFSDISNDPRRLEDEIAGSKRDFEARLGIECKYISWPFGERSDADDASLAMARDAGYRACFGAFRGTVVPRVTDRFSIPRHHFEPHWPVNHIAYFARGNMESA